MVHILKTTTKNLYETLPLTTTESCLKIPKIETHHLVVRKGVSC